MGREENSISVEEPMRDSEHPVRSYVGNSFCFLKGWSKNSRSLTLWNTLKNITSPLSGNRNDPDTMRLKYKYFVVAR